MDAATLAQATVKQRRAAVASNPSNVATRIVAGRFGTLDASVAKTFQFSMECVDDFDAVRVILGNNSKDYSPGVLAVAATAPSSAADVNNSAGAWVTGTRQGQPGFTLPTAQQGTDLPVFVTTDWIPVQSVARSDGGTHPLVTVRAYLTANAALPVLGNGTDSFTNWATRSDGGRRFWWRHKDGDQITAPAGFDSTTDQSQSPIVGVQYLCRGQVVTVAICGDSIAEGRGTYIGEGFVLPAVEQLNAAGGPVRYEYASFGYSGQPYDRIAERAIIVATSEVKPDVLLLPVGTPNPTADGALTDAAVQAIRTRRARVFKALRGNDVVPVLWTWLPTNTSVRDYAGTDAKRVALNNEVLGQESRNFIVADTAAAVAGATVSGQVQLAAGSTTDNIHPNDSGNATLAAVVKPKIIEATRRSAGGRARAATRADAPVFYITDQYTSGSPLTMAQAGVYVYNRSAASFFNLPLLAPGVTPDSQVYTLRVRPTSYAVIVNRSGSDALAVGGAPRASLTVKPGQSVTFVPGSGGVWDVLGLDYSRFRAVTTSAATTLTLDLSAEAYIFTGSATATWNLPSVPTSGQTYKIKNRGSAAVNVYGSGTGKVFDTAVADFVSVAAGAKVELTWDGTYWCTV